MSKYRSEPVTYHCSNDCRMEGCPGHTMVEIFDRSTDVYIIEIDEKPEYYFDENVLSTFLKLHEKGKNK